jgi:hypothetical protein
MFPSFKSSLIPLLLCGHEFWQHSKNLWLSFAKRQDFIPSLLSIQTDMCLLIWMGFIMWNGNESISTYHGPSWEVNINLASQDIFHLLHNPKVHYHSRKRPPLDPRPYTPTQFLRSHFIYNIYAYIMWKELSECKWDCWSYRHFKGFSLYRMANL